MKEDQNKDNSQFDLIMEIQNKIETLKCIQENEVNTQKLLSNTNNTIESITEKSEEKKEALKPIEGTSTYATYNRFTDEGKYFYILY